MAPAFEPLAQGALTMVIEALNQRRTAGQVVVRLLRGIQQAAFEITDLFVQYAAVAGNLQVPAGGQRQPQQVIGAAGAHPALQRWMPPVLHVAFGILMGGAHQ
ncbi:hypothetical protein D9M71_651540 [compost metagenome]